KDILAASHVDQINGRASRHGRDLAVGRCCYCAYAPGTPPNPPRFLGPRKRASVQGAIDGTGKQSLPVRGEIHRFKAAPVFCLLLMTRLAESPHFLSGVDVPDPNEWLWIVHIAKDNPGSGGDDARSGGLGYVANDGQKFSIRRERERLERFGK